jgi:hypothetical protein
VRQEQVKKNRGFYERSKEWIAEQYLGRYVIIADGEIKDARDGYAEAIERSVELEKIFLTSLVFKAGEEPFFGTEAHGLGASCGPVEEMARDCTQSTR